MGVRVRLDKNHTKNYFNNLYIKHFKIYSNNRLTTYFDYKTTVELLAHLGYNYYYEDNQSSALVGMLILFELKNLNSLLFK